MTAEKIMKGLEKLIERLSIANDVEPQKAKHVFRLVLEYSSGNGLSDVELEEMTGYKQQEVRKILRMFYDLRMMVYNKGKLPQQEAIRYFWKADMDAINLALLKRKRAVLSKLKYRLEYETREEMYVCPVEGIRYTFSEAFDNEFLCPSCGTPLERDQNEKAIEVLRKFIERLEQEIQEDEKRVYSS
ncbi:MAG: transcription initiation factor IIE subunit alpha [Acidilobaceae archaeon]